MLFQGLVICVDFVAVPTHELEVIELIALLLVGFGIWKIVRNNRIYQEK
jgi:hypothetical protein